MEDLRYAAMLRINEKRLGFGDRLMDEAGAVVTMTNWLRRCLRDQPYAVVSDATVRVIRSHPLSGRRDIALYATVSCRPA